MKTSRFCCNSSATLSSPVSARLNMKMSTAPGTMQDVIIDEVDADGAFGRSVADAPDIDGCVFLNGDTEVRVGDIVTVRIEHTDEYDMWGIRV